MIMTELIILLFILDEMSSDESEDFMIDIIETFYLGEPFQMLANAIVEQAARDYKAAYLMIKKDPENEEAMDTVLEVERFFGSGWYQFLTKLDAGYLMRKIREEVQQVKKQKG